MNGELESVVGHVASIVPPDAPLHFRANMVCNQLVIETRRTNEELYEYLVESEIARLSTDAVYNAIRDEIHE